MEYTIIPASIFVFSLCTEYSFCCELSRKSVSSAFFNTELHEELVQSGRKCLLSTDDQKEAVMKLIEQKRVRTAYSHTQAETCEEKG